MNPCALTVKKHYQIQIIYIYIYNLNVIYIRAQKLNVKAQLETLEFIFYIF